MPVNVVHTPQEEEAWERAKEIAANEYPEASGPDYWRIVMGIYKKITHYVPQSSHRDHAPFRRFMR
ncbi:MAG TPA: hypothetical protein VMT64_15125 [Candidatus Binataceae bacterium]|nr:hypothetical protein [Candidatus Binataceae bacterium]